jgi:para-nitrobenzyl esterase
MLAIVLCAVQSAMAEIETAKVTGGEVQGVIQDGITSFKGIPFAAPPVGDLRWKSPQSVTPWTGIKRADAFGPSPMQAGDDTNLSEDCLYLNVWTPAKDPNEKRPAMVWIYGGGFVAGSTNWPFIDGTHLAQKGVVLVSIAYRVGPFGLPTRAWKRWCSIRCPAPDPCRTWISSRSGTAISPGAERKPGQRPVLA